MVIYSMGRSVSLSSRSGEQQNSLFITGISAPLAHTDFFSVCMCVYVCDDRIGNCCERKQKGLGFVSVIQAAGPPLTTEWVSVAERLDSTVRPNNRKINEMNQRK